jgi:Zn-dependent protease
MELGSLQDHIRIMPFVLPIVLLAFALHEMAHAYVATWFGDPTPERHGRRTLNPIRHLDPVGTIMLVASLLLLGFPMGFAVTPVDDRRMRKPRLHGALTALAGPITNIVLCLASMVLYIVALQRVGPDSFHLGATNKPLLIEIPEYAMYFNAFLAVFNLLPIPPLDGGRVVGSALRPDLAVEWNKIAEYGTFIIIGLIVIGGASFTSAIGSMQLHLIDLVYWVIDAFGLTTLT